MNTAPPTTIRHKSVLLRFQDTRGTPAYVQPKYGAALPAPREQWQEADSVANTDTTVLEHIPGLRRYARALAGRAAEADELVQECLSRAPARRQQPSDIPNPRPYLFTHLPHLPHNPPRDPCLRSTQVRRCFAGAKGTMAGGRQRGEHGHDGS